MDIYNLKEIIKRAFFRDKIILADLNSTLDKKIINLHWFKEKFSNGYNIGDMLSPIVVEYAKTVHMIKPKEVLRRKPRHLYAIGSIIAGGYQDATIWGSGILRGKSKYWWSYFRKLDIRSVRGPETRQVMLSNGYKCPEIYGDPAILLPMIYQPNVSKKCEYRVIPHYIFGTKYPNVLSPVTDNWKSFIDQVVNSELIISSSLHGIILAEAYGIPAILLNDHDMDLFKYRDYYYGTGRYEFPVASSVEEALSMQPAQIPDFTKMRKDLLDSFPSDLWE